MRGKLHKRRKRRATKAFLKFWSSATPTHKLIGGRTGSLMAKVMKSRMGRIDTSIKPLKWGSKTHYDDQLAGVGWEIKAPTPVGAYSVNYFDGHDFPYLVQRGPIILNRTCETIAEAKACAEADYRNLVMSMLEE